MIFPVFVETTSRPSSAGGPQGQLGSLRKQGLGDKTKSLAFRMKISQLYQDSKALSLVYLGGVVLVSTWMGVASLEAKRKFRAPRVSPTAANETKNCTASIIDYENSGNAIILITIPNMSLPQNDLNLQSPYHVSMIHEEKKNPEHAVLQQPRKQIHKPCLGLHKEHCHANVHDTVEEKTREVYGKDIVR